jgi:hypothetical protein
MALASDYPITQRFGFDPTYPLNDGNHYGLDFGAPMATPVVVNGLLLGYSGQSGEAFGPHVHVGRFVSGKATDPLPYLGRATDGRGFLLPTATIYDTGYNTRDGLYVRVSSLAAVWCFLHLDTIAPLRPGQAVTGPAGGRGGGTLTTQQETPTMALATRDEIIQQHQAVFFADPPQSTLDAYVGKRNLGDALREFMNTDARKQIEALYITATRDNWQQQIVDRTQERDDFKTQLLDIQAKINAGQYEAASKACALPSSVTVDMSPSFWVKLGAFLTAWKS